MLAAKRSLDYLVGGQQTRDEGRGAIGRLRIGSFSLLRLPACFPTFLNSVPIQVFCWKGHVSSCLHIFQQCHPNFHTLDFWKLDFFLFLVSNNLLSRKHWLCCPKTCSYCFLQPFSRDVSEKLFHLAPKEAMDFYGFPAFLYYIETFKA